MSIREIPNSETIWDLPNGKKMFSINDRIVRVEDRHGKILEMPGVQQFIQDALPLTHQELTKLMREYQLRQIS